MIFAGSGFAQDQKHAKSISSIKEDRPADLRFFITDSTKFKDKSGLSWEKNDKQTGKEIYDWIKQNEKDLKSILA